MPIVGDFSCQSPLRRFYEEFFPDKTPHRDLAEVYQENLHRKRDAPATRTIVQSLSNVKHRMHMGVVKASVCNAGLTVSHLTVFCETSLSNL